MQGFIGSIINYWMDIGFGLLISSFAYFFKLLRRYKSIMVSAEHGVRSLLKGELIRRYYELREQQGISIYDKQIIEDLYKEYSQLGGNGVISDLVAEINKLPILDTTGGD